MKKLKKLMIFSLFSTVLVQSCITVPRIDKKDSRNNLFSQELQNFMATKHPQKIDTVARKTSSDTTVTESDSVFYSHYNGVHNDLTATFFGGRDRTHVTTGYFLYDTISKTWSANDTVKWNPLWVRTKHDTIVRHEVKIRTITIHDTVKVTLVNNSEVNGLRTYLQASRDSTNQFILKYTQQQSTSRARLIWIIGLGIVLVVGIYFTIKKGIL